MMPSAPLRSAVSKPFWICCGEPSVAIVFDVQPSLAAASATILPCVWQAAAPQLMNTSFLPVGHGLADRRADRDGARALGRLRRPRPWPGPPASLPPLVADDDELAFVLSEPELPLEPHPATATSAAARATAPGRAGTCSTPM